MTVESNESLRDRPVVESRDRNDNMFPVEYVGQDGGAYVFDLDLTLAEEGLVTVEAEATDLQGNVGMGIVSVFVDRTAPTLSVSIAEQLLGSGDHVLSVTASEVLDRPPDVTLADADGAFVLLSQPTRSGNAWHYSFSIDEVTAQGQGTIQVGGRDLAGNSAHQEEQFHIDSVAPTFELSAPTIAGLGAFQVEITPDEILPSLPTLSMVDTDGDSIQAIGPSFDGTRYVFTALTTTDTQSGYATITATVSDAAGNSRTEVASVLIDTGVPSLVVSVSPDPPHDADGPILIWVTSDEELIDPPQVTASLDGTTALPISEPTRTGNQYEYKWSCNVSDIAVIEVEASDLAGNAARETLTFADVSIDYSDVSFSSIPTLGSDVTITATVRNVGSTYLENVPVGIYHARITGLHPIGDLQYVSLEPDESSPVSVNWPSHRQEAGWRIITTVDPDDILPETDETNNVTLHGPTQAAHGADDSTYLLSDAHAQYWVAPFDSSTMRPVNDTEAAVQVWVKDESGSVALGPVMAAYDTVTQRFEIDWTPSQLLGPGMYDLVSETTSIVDPPVFAPIENRLSVRVIRDFSTTVASDQAQYDREDVVTISGHVQDIDGTALPNLPVSLTLSNDQYGTRHFAATTEDDGRYQLDYAPLPTEAGQYQVMAAVSQGTETRTSEATSFEVLGLYLQAETTSARLVAGSERTVTYRLVNVGTSNLTNLNVTLDDSAASIDVQASLDLAGTATTLEPG